MHILKEYQVKTTNLSVMRGVQYIYKFPNGYGASVIKGEHTYGGKQGLWEIAVLDQAGELCYTTSVTNDVIGHLNDPEVHRVLLQIKEL